MLLGIVSFVLGRRVLPEWREQNPGRLPDAASVALLTAGLALAAYGIVQTEKWGWGSGRFVLFDRFQPQGGDIWMMERFE
jgi:hypothetical protein